MDEQDGETIFESAAGNVDVTFVVEHGKNLVSPGWEAWPWRAESFPAKYLDLDGVQVQAVAAATLLASKLDWEHNTGESPRPHESEDIRALESHLAQFPDGANTCFDAELSWWNPRLGHLPTLQADRIALRPFRMADVRALMKWGVESEARRWFDWPDQPPDDHVGHTELIIEQWHREWRTGVTAPFAIALDGDAIGNAELRSEQTGWRVSYLVAEEHRSLGYARTAVEALLRWAISTLDVRSFYLEAATENRASRTVAERTGFREATRSEDTVVHHPPEIGQRRATIRYERFVSKEGR